jgi:hypothetical protein
VGWKSLTAKHFPLPPKAIREWLAQRRQERHVALAHTALRVLDANVFSNVTLIAFLPHVQDGTVSYVFAYPRIANWFKLTFA